MRALLLIDHDNIRPSDIDIATIVRIWIDANASALPSQIYVDIRAYGGWFAETSVSPSRFAAADYYQRQCPAVMRHSDRLCRMTFTFADKLLCTTPTGEYDDRPGITHTVAMRSTALFTQAKPAAPCSEADCELSRVRKWLKKRRACPKSSCPHPFGTYFARLEQKQVDVHLAVDLLRAVAAGFDHIIIASEDWDMLPAILAAAEVKHNDQRLSVFRFRPSSTYLDRELSVRGVTILSGSATSE